MFIDFISISADPDEFDDLEDFLYHMNDIEPTIRKSISIHTEEIRRFETSIHDNEWTDVFTIDGDIITAEMSYSDFRTNFYIALNQENAQTWEMLSSKDGEVKIRYYKN